MDIVDKKQHKTKYKKQHKKISYPNNFYLKKLPLKKQINLIKKIDNYNKNI